MSSRESFAEKRTDLVRIVEDQIENGIYATLQKEAKVKDPITGVEKTVTQVEIITKDGKPQRQEAAQLTAFGIRPFNFTIKSLDYYEDVERQIQQQQQLNMEVQISIAEAKKAEQRAITVAEQGKANAAQAKWEQEVEKAKAVTKAEQELEVARLNAQAAEQFKRAEILRGEGEGTRKRLVMQADGGLQAKLEAIKEINKYYADAIKDYKGAWVPQIVMGGEVGRAPGGAANDFIDLLKVKAARDMAVDMSIAGREQTKPKQ